MINKINLVSRLPYVSISYENKLFTTGSTVKLSRLTFPLIEVCELG